MRVNARCPCTQLRTRGVVAILSAVLGFENSFRLNCPKNVVYGKIEIMLTTEDKLAHLIEILEAIRDEKHADDCDMPFVPLHECMCYTDASELAREALEWIER